jgi:hypothetical protein
VAFEIINAMTENDTQHSAWNPGLESALPKDFRPLETIFRPENVVRDYAAALEQSRISGLSPEDFVEFKPMRLALHELLIRVSTQISIPEGKNHLDLGFNYRAIVNGIYEQAIVPRQAEIEALCAKSKEEITQEAARVLDLAFFAPDKPVKPRGMFSSLGNKTAPAPKPRSYDDDVRTVEQFRERMKAVLDPKELAVSRACYKILNASLMQHGRIQLPRDYLIELAASMAANEYASVRVGEYIQPLITAAAQERGDKLLTMQNDPMVINVKGSSASGKTSLRPLQKALAQDAQSNLDDFAIISPDVWRKALLNYDGLGDAKLYAGTLTGREIKLVDDKLDRLMARNASLGTLPNMLIDRFRSDSFASGRQASDSYTGTAKSTHMFFIVTPPDATVERAWSRGLETGRYKAVDDLIAHNIETYKGMPELILKWISKSITQQGIDYTLLDNSVPKGERPKIIAYGKNGELNIIDIKGMLNITGFAKLNVDATSPDALYRPEAHEPKLNTDLLHECLKRIPSIQLVDEDRQPYASIHDGKLTIIDPLRFDAHILTDEGKALMGLIGKQAHTSISGASLAGVSQRVSTDKEI